MGAPSDKDGRRPRRRSSPRSRGRVPRRRPTNDYDFDYKCFARASEMVTQPRSKHDTIGSQLCCETLARRGAERRRWRQDWTMCGGCNSKTPRASPTHSKVEARDGSTCAANEMLLVETWKPAACVDPRWCAHIAQGLSQRLETWEARTHTMDSATTGTRTTMVAATAEAAANSNGRAASDRHHQHDARAVRARRLRALTAKELLARRHSCWPHKNRDRLRVAVRQDMQGTEARARHKHHGMHTRT